MWSSCPRPHLRPGPRIATLLGGSDSPGGIRGICFVRGVDGAVLCPSPRCLNHRTKAAIAALHDEASSAQETDWHQVRLLYDELFALTPTPVVALNRAIAISWHEGPQAGLDHLEALADEPSLTRQHHGTPALRIHRGRGMPGAAQYPVCFCCQRTHDGA